MRDGSTLYGWPLFLGREEASGLIGMSPSTFDKAVKDGLVPKPVLTVYSLRRWYRPDLEAWAKDRRAAAEAVSDDDVNPWDEAV